MDDTAKMIRLLRRLKVETNGAVVEAMQRRGMDYPLSYGVSVATIRDIARAYGPCHSLALHLFRQQVRELKLAAAFIDDPARVTREQMREWAASFTNAELTEQVVHALFRHAPQAGEMALEWMEADRGMLRYAGLLTAASVAGQTASTAEARRFFEAADRIALRGDSGAAESRAIVTVLRKLAARNGAMRDAVLQRIETYRTADAPALRDIADELSWQVEYSRK